MDEVFVRMLHPCIFQVLPFTIFSRAKRIYLQGFPPKDGDLTRKNIVIDRCEGTLYNQVLCGKG